jgi:hypothetical protein
MATRDTLLSRNLTGGVAPVRQDTTRADPSAFGYGPAMAAAGERMVDTAINVLRYAGHAAKQDEARQDADYREKLRLITRQTATEYQSAAAEPLAMAEPGTEVEVTEKLLQGHRSTFDTRVAELQKQFPKAKSNPDEMENAWMSVAGPATEMAFETKAVKMKKDRVVTSYANAADDMAFAAGSDPTNTALLVNVYDDNLARMKAKQEAGMLSNQDVRQYAEVQGRRDLFNALTRTVSVSPDLITQDLVNDLVKTGRMDPEDGSRLLSAKPTAKKTNLSEARKVYEAVVDQVKTGKITAETALKDPKVLDVIESNVSDPNTGEINQDLVKQSLAGMGLYELQGRVTQSIDKGAIISPDLFVPAGERVIRTTPTDAFLQLDIMDQATVSTESFRAFLEKTNPGFTKPLTEEQLDEARADMAGKAKLQRTQLETMQSNVILQNDPYVAARMAATPDDIQGISIAMAEAAKAQGIPERYQVNVHPDHLQPLLSAIDSKDPAKVTAEAVGLSRALGSDAPSVMASFFYKPDFPKDTAAALFYVSGVGENPDSPYNRAVAVVFQDMTKSLTFRQTRVSDPQYKDKDETLTELDQTLLQAGQGNQSIENMRIGLQSRYGTEAGRGLVDLAKSYNLYINEGAQTPNKNPSKSSRETMARLGARFMVVRNGPESTALTVTRPVADKEEQWFQMATPQANTSIAQEAEDTSSFLDALILGPQPAAGFGGFGETVERYGISLFGGLWDLNDVPAASTRMIDPERFPIPEPLQIPFSRLYAKVPNTDGSVRVMTPSRDPINTHSLPHETAQKVADYTKGRIGSGIFSNNLLAVRQNYRWIQDDKNQRWVLSMRSGSVSAENAGSIKVGEAQPLFYTDKDGQEKQFTVSYADVQKGIDRWRGGRTFFQSMTNPMTDPRSLTFTRDGDKKPVQKPWPGQQEELDAIKAKKDASRSADYVPTPGA